MNLSKSAEQLLKQRGDNLKELWEDETWNAVVNSKAESPIEQLFLIEWYFQTDIYLNPADYKNYYILPQHEIEINEKKYRVDFLVIYSKEPQLMKKNESVIVELDSYLWHGRTPEQFEKEKKRERNLMETGYKILRFSGREIVYDVHNCVEKVIIFLTNLK